MARSYDPLNAPDPDDWQSMDEDERMMLIMEYHREAGVELPNEQVHAVVHVVVENQFTLGDEMSARAALERLMREGLDRHEAIHAVGSVLVDFVQALIRDDAAPGANERYNEELEKLTAAEWLKTFQSFSYYRLIGLECLMLRAKRIKARFLKQPPERLMLLFPLGSRANFVMQQVIARQRHELEYATRDFAPNVVLPERLVAVLFCYVKTNGD